jgi:hypothetical protein
MDVDETFSPEKDSSSENKKKKKSRRTTLCRLKEMNSDL